MYQSSNWTIKKLRQNGDAAVVNRATYVGVAIKSIILAVVTLASAIVSIVLVKNYIESMDTILISALVGSLVFGLVAAFAPSTIPVAGTLYCVCIGIVMGAVSYVINEIYSGVVPLALLSTAIVLVTITVLYATGAIKISERFRSVMMTALISMVMIGFVLAIITWIVPSLWNLFYGDSLLSIAISVVMVLLASFFLVVDLDAIHQTVTLGLDKKYEWRAAYSLTITIIWLYMEFLRLFAKVAERKK